MFARSFRSELTEAELLARIEREQNPVRKAKDEIKLGRLKLLEAISAYDNGDYGHGETTIGAYVGRMKHCWDTLRSSGRQAARHPQGFKELDIALREDSRQLEDLKHRVPYEDREPLENVTREIETIRGEVLNALFPAAPLHSGKPAPIRLFGVGGSSVQGPTDNSESHPNGPGL